MLRWSARTRESNSAKLVIDGGMLAPAPRLRPAPSAIAWCPLARFHPPCTGMRARVPTKDELAHLVGVAGAPRLDDRQATDAQPFTALWATAILPPPTGSPGGLRAPRKSRPGRTAEQSSSFRASRAGQFYRFCVVNPSKHRRPDRRSRRRRALDGGHHRRLFR
jgi:hypothetical protein